MSNELDMAIDHVSLSVSDLARAKAFYGAVLQTVDLELVGEFGPELTGTVATAGFGRGRKGNFWLSENGHQRPAAHVCFRARSRAAVRAFHAKGIAAGGSDNGEPGVREIYHPAYYAAFIIDPEGHNIEAVCFEQEV